MSLRSSAVASAEALSSIFTVSPDGIVVTDRHGVVLFANPAAMRMMRPAGVAMVGSEFGHPTTGRDTARIRVAETGVTAEMRVARLEWEGRPARLVTLR